MKITKKSGLFAGGVASAVMLMASGALAVSAISVDGTTSPAGQVAVAGVNAGALAFATDFTIPASCAVSSVSGKINRGASATSGTTIGQVDSLAFGTTSAPCSLTALNIPILVEKDSDPMAPAYWPVELTATPAKGSSIAPIVIRDVTATMHSTGNPPWGCELKAEGDITGTFNQVTQQVRINTPPAFPLDLTTFNGAGTQTPAPSTCVGLIATSNFANMVGTFTLSSPGVGGIHW